MSTKPVLVVCGSRAWSDPMSLWCHLDHICKNHRPLAFRPSAVWHGGATGADCLASAWARTNKIPVREFPADWRQFGKRAGIMRSRDMLDAAPAGSAVAAFVQPSLNQSRGTAFTVNESVSRHIATWLVVAGQPGWWICSPEGLRSIA